MIRRAAFGAGLVFLTAAALALRVPDLGSRPFHGDEAVHAFKFRDVWEHGVYRYDPNEYHGPTLYYAALPTVALSGRHSFAETTEADYRLATALIGAALIPLIGLLRDGLGRRGALWAALFAAISPAFAFYSRYYIQEMLLVFFSVAFLVCGWRYTRSRKIPWLLAAGVAGGLMVATKETAVLAFISAAVAAFPSIVRGRAAGVGEVGAAKQHGLRRYAAAVILALATAYLFLSGFMSNPSGPIDYLHSYTPWLGRSGVESLHGHSWSYYLSLLTWTHRAKGPVWSEGLILGLALVGIIAAITRQGQAQDRGDSGFVRFVATYSVVQLLVYSVIPYKTPWLALNFLAGFALMAGFGAVTVVELVRPIWAQALLALAILAGSAQLGFQANRTCFEYAADYRNPYVYAHPLQEVVELGKRVDELAEASADGRSMVVKVISKDGYYWPLPWYLRRLDNVGYWTGSVPGDPAAPVVIASPEFDEELTRRLDKSHLMTGFHALRPGVLFQLWVRMDVWERYLKTRPKPPAVADG